MNNTQEVKKEKKNTKKTGDLGEGIASKFLERNGFTILSRNYRKKWGEIDIVAIKNEIIHFVEVKSVSCRTFPKVGLFSKDVNHETGIFRPEDNVHKFKYVKLSKAIQSYILEHHLEQKEWAIDVVTVYINKDLRLGRAFFIGNIII
jgi:putative endonuclease